MTFEEKLKILIEDGEKLLGTKHRGKGGQDDYEYVDHSLFLSWKNRIKSLIRGTFGIASEEYAFFQMGVSGRNLEVTTGYQKRLKDLLSDLESGFLILPSKKLSISAFSKISNLLHKFSSIERQLRRRHENRKTLTIKDEYDVQDLLHALLLEHFNNIKTEECCPSYGGGKGRVDFLLEEEKILIETKHTRKGLADKELTKELIEDRAFYSTHPSCKTLICFIYDPKKYIVNKSAIMRDIEKTNDLNVKVIIET